LSKINSTIPLRLTAKVTDHDLSSKNMFLHPADFHGTAQMKVTESHHLS